MKRQITGVAVVLGSVLFTCLLAEAVLRAIGFSYPNFYTHDEQLGTRLRPGAEGWSRDEGEAYIRINSDGLRDRERPVAKLPGTLRIAVLGDSYAEAQQVSMDSAFWARLESALRSCAELKGRSVDVVNFGVAGYSTGQELLTLRRHAWRYAPDVVLLAFLSGNDVRDNSKAIAGRFAKPFFLLDGEALVLDQSFRDSWVYKLKTSGPLQMITAMSDYSRLLQLVHKASGRLGRPLTAPRSAADSEGKSGEVGLDSAIYSAPRSPEWIEAWELTERLIMQMNTEVRARGARFVLVSLTNGIQVHPDKKRRDAFAGRLGVEDLFYPDRRIEALARRESIPHLLLAPPMQRYADQHQEYLHGFPNAVMGGGHWNEKGHEVAGRLIADYMCSESGVLH